MGETRKAIFSSSQPGLAALIDEAAPLTVETPGGRIQIQWDYEAKATPNGQLAFFAEFLKTSGVYRKWVESCPLSYSSPNASEKEDVLGTWLLSILAGHNRYAHVTGLRGDGVSREILGMENIVSEDALRRALARMSGEESQAWLQPQLLDSVGEALKTPWILDIDTTIKPLYGKQEGAEVGYNPHKPGRPSHALHTYWVGNLRLVLDVVVAPGNKSSSADTRPGLGAVLDSLQPEQLPALVRGDCGFGNEPFIRELEDRGQAYLFKLRQTKGVQRLLARQFERTDWTQPGPSDQGWSAVKDTLKLTGWDKKRRVVILRRAIQSDLALSRNNSEGQLELLLPGQDVQAWEYAVLVTSSRYGLDAMAQLYRDRADVENGFDELKNQWGCGFGLQLVELVLSGRPTRGQDGGHHQPAALTGRRWQGRQTRRTDLPAPYPDACCQGESDEAHLQCSRGHEPCEGNRGAVAFCRPLENAARLYHRQNHPQKNAKTPDTGGLFTRLTAVFRMTKNSCSQPARS
jgi:hypothetical protein